MIHQSLQLAFMLYKALRSCEQKGEHVKEKEVSETVSYSIART